MSHTTRIEQLAAFVRCSLKAHNAEVHTQPVLETVLRLRQEHGLDRQLDDIERIELEVFKQAYDITGSGEEAGNKYDVRTKEQADHSLPYLTAVALLDGEVTPRQFTSERMQAADVQALLKKVRTLRDDQFTVRYPHETPWALARPWWRSAPASAGASPVARRARTASCAPAGGYAGSPPAAARWAVPGPPAPA